MLRPVLAHIGYFLFYGIAHWQCGYWSDQSTKQAGCKWHDPFKSSKRRLERWSDYVLQKNYQLRPLSEVKDYINQNQHLPEILSEQEMIKKGLDVGEMNKLLMKKVEELTLYLIEKDKQIRDHQALAEAQADSIKRQAEITKVQADAIEILQSQEKLLIASNHK